MIIADQCGKDTEPCGLYYYLQILSPPLSNNVGYCQLRGFEPLWLVVLILRQHYFQLDFLLFSR